MEMIIGGAFQGKSAYARQQFPDILFRNGESLDDEELIRSKGIVGLHRFIRKEMKKGRTQEALMALMTQLDPEVILVTDEVGYGVVPLDPFDRSFREVVGRICTELAARSSRVTRIVCGVPSVIKDTGKTGK